MPISPVRLTSPRFGNGETRLNKDQAIANFNLIQEKLGRLLNKEGFSFYDYQESLKGFASATQATGIRLVDDAKPMPNLSLRG